MEFELSPLPYASDALVPYISATTLEYHYGKHHRAYVTNLNKLLREANLSFSSLEEVVQKTEGPIFNNAAQVWNHTFYWNCLSPQGGGEPSGDLAVAIIKQWGSFEQFRVAFTNVALTTFGSGWAWLVKKNNGELAVISTSNAQTPLNTSDVALLTCDVWEHAYYVDYYNRRPDYLEAFWKLVNWSFVVENFAR